MRRNSDERIRALERAATAAPGDRNAELAWLIALERSGAANGAQRMRLKRLGGLKNATFEVFAAYDSLYVAAVRPTRDRDGRVVAADLSRDCWRWADQASEWEREFLGTFEQENEAKLTKKQREAALEVVANSLYDACLAANQVDLLVVAEDVAKLVNNAAESATPTGVPVAKAVVGVRDDSGSSGVWFTLNRNFRRACQASRHNCGTMQRVTAADVLHVATGWAYLSGECRLEIRHSADPMQHVDFDGLNKDIMAAVLEVNRRRLKTNGDWQDFQAWIPASARVAIDGSPDELRALRERALYYWWVSIRREFGAGQRLLFDLPDWDWLKPKAKNQRRRNSDERTRRLERLAAQGDQTAADALVYEQLRAGVVTPASRQLTYRPPLVREIEAHLWNMVENWGDDGLRFYDTTVLLPLAAHILDVEWSQPGAMIEEEWEDHDGTPLVTPTAAEGRALLEQIVPRAERSRVLSMLVERLDEVEWDDLHAYFGPRVMQDLSGDLPRVAPNASQR